MEQLRHRLTNVSPEGKRCSVGQNTLKRSDLDDFVACYFGKNSDKSRASRHDRKPTWSEKNEKGRWRAYKYEELIKRDKINLDILTPRFPARRPRGPGLVLRSQRIQVWLKDEALEDSANLPAPEVDCGRNCGGFGSCASAVRCYRIRSQPTLIHSFPSADPSGYDPSRKFPGGSIAEDLEAALQQCTAIAQDLKNDRRPPLGAP
jgi:hypothetical protein